MCLMETARERKAVLVLLQEPPMVDGHRHLAFESLRAGIVTTARRVDSEWTLSTEDVLTRETGGDVQVLALGKRGHRGRVLRVVNAYFQISGQDGDHRTAERAFWDDIFAEQLCNHRGFQRPQTNVEPPLHRQTTKKRDVPGDPH